MFKRRNLTLLSTKWAHFKFDACNRSQKSRHCITHLHDSVIDITKWAQEYFQKPLSVNKIRCAICRCQLKLYHAKRKPYVNMVQMRCCVLWAKANLKWTVCGKVFYGQTNPNLTFFHKCKRYGHVLEGTMTAERYIKVLEQQMLPSRRHVFQQDNAKPHTAAITTAWLLSRRVRCWIGLPGVQIFHLYRTFGASLNEKYIKDDHKLFSCKMLHHGKHAPSQLFWDL